MSQSAYELRPRFFFDLGSADCWLAAEQVHRVFGEEALWCPVSEATLLRATDGSAWATSALRELGLGRVEERAEALGLGRVRWPYPWPNESCRSMRVAAYADAIGRCEPFALAAFRLQFLEGQRLADWHVIATAVCTARLPGRSALDAPMTDLFKARLRELTIKAFDAGVRSLPAIKVGERIFPGEEALPEALAYWRSACEESLSTGPL